MRRRTRQRALTGRLILLVLLAFSVAPAAHALEDSAACGRETARQERQHSIPDRLLQAISLVESGRWDAERREVLAWPWTVMAEGEGRFLPSKEAAIAEVRKLQARGVKNIDVGCMQVNLQAHAQAFASLDEAFEPATNVAYAAQFLDGLHDSTGNWPTAGAYYHSQTPDLAAEYKARLVATWDKVRRQGDDRARDDVADGDKVALNVVQNRPPLGIPLAALPARPTISPDIAFRQAAALGTQTADRLAAQKAANAYRQAKLEEYRQRKAQMGSTRTTQAAL